MTDNEIIKALECCTTETCWDCPFEPKEQRKGTFGCCEENIKNALDFINRQKAEIERLKGDLHDCVREVSRSHEIDKNKAIEKFADKLKKEKQKKEILRMPFFDTDIDNLVAEMKAEESGNAES